MTSEEIVLGLDATDDPVHGQQEGRSFMATTTTTGIFPLYILPGEHLLCARLRRSNIEGPSGIGGETGTDLRPDSADLAGGLDHHPGRLGLLPGWIALLVLAKNDRLKSEIAEELTLRPKPSATPPARGDMEWAQKNSSWICSPTEPVRQRCAPTTLAVSVRAAYMLMHTLCRLGLKQTLLARAQCQTIRLKLLKIGTQVRLTARNVWISMLEAYPYNKSFAAIVRNFLAIPLRC